MALNKAFITVITGFILLATGYSIGYYISNKENKFIHEANNFKYEVITAYGEYEDAVEAVLDTLEYDCNWVDRWDFYDYYESRQKLDSILLTQQ